MKFKQFRLIFFLSSIILLSSCLGSTTVTTTSNDPAFVSLTFAVNDSIPYLSTAVFTLVDKTIVNLDSLPYKTRIDSVYPTFSFVSSVGTILYFPGGNKYNKDSVLITGTDTIDFNKAKFVKNIASDGTTPSPKYEIKVNVHKVDPEVYIWNKLIDNLNGVNAISQKAIVLNDKILYYQNDGSTNYLNASKDGSNWNSATISGLPTNASLEGMVQFNGKLYLTQNGDKIYSSSDGLNWTNNGFTIADYTFKSIMFGINDSLMAITQSKSDQLYRFASSKDGLTWIIKSNNVLPANFPVNNFASITYSSSTGKTKGLVLQGSRSTNSSFYTNWSTEDGYYWVNFSNENHTLDTLAVGASVISYDSKLLVFGTRIDNGQSFYKVSIDEGLSWQIPDMLRNILPNNFTPRDYQSTVVLNPLPIKGVQTPDKTLQILQSNRIFILGGKSGSTSYSDVWTGKLTRKNFLRQ